MRWQNHLIILFVFRRVGLEKWLQSTIAAFDAAGREILDNIEFTQFLVRGANVPPSGFEQRHKVRAAASKSTAIPREGSTEKRMSIEDFELVKTLGQGSFGRVVLVRCKVCLL